MTKPERDLPSEALGITPEQMEAIEQNVREKLATVTELEPITDSPRWPNIKLEGKRIVRTDAGEAFYTQDVEFFLDEHGYQWVKFTPKNGPHEGREHCMRTEKIHSVIDNRKA